MRGKKGDHLPHERSERAKKSKPNQQAPPLDPAADFDTPTRQEKLIETEPFAEVAIKNDFMVAEFIQPHLSRNKDDKAFIAFEISFPLTEEHLANRKLLPGRIVQAWQEATVKIGLDKVSIPDVPAQDIEIALAPDAVEKVTRIELKFAEIEQAKISVVEAKGDGKAKEVTRLQFRAKVELDMENWRFAKAHFAHTVWLKLAQTQGSLLEAEAA